MADEPKPERPVRFRTAAHDKRKALEHYQDLRRAGKSKRAVVISEGEDGTVTVLGQMLKPHEIGQLLLIAADALSHAEEGRTIAKLESHQEPHRRGERVGRARKPEVTYAPDGTLIPPEGENLISCGECNHPRWYIFHRNETDDLARYSCAHCGNEVKAIPIFHAEGRA
jgi:hypothetical protein